MSESITKKDATPTGVAPERFASRNTGGPLKISAKYAGDTSTTLPQGSGDAFVAFVRSKGLDVNVRRTITEWDVLAKEFSAKTIYGVRRSQNNGLSHQPIKSKLG